jgi:hypothetical protein
VLVFSTKHVLQICSALQVAARPQQQQQQQQTLLRCGAIELRALHVRETGKADKAMASHLLRLLSAICVSLAIANLGKQ